MFPAIRLTAALGFESSELTDLLKTESLIWGLAGSLAQPIFDGGRNRGRVERAKAAYAENLADYRQRLLVALSEVENALTALRLIGEQSDVQARALANADKAAGLASVRYKAGLVAVLEVIDAQRTKLAAEREMVQLRTQRLAAGVALVKALGGGWKPVAAAPATAGAAPVPRT
jgi:multidrug efflux system outer membrane protein